MLDLPRSATGETAVSVARRAARDACEVLRAGFGIAGVARVKGDDARNVVTEVDLTAERITTAVLRNSFPDHEILAEETASSVRSDGWLWVLDPLDGTKNYSRGIPHFCFSLALCHESRPVLGIIAHPILGDEYLAVRGRGTTLNGQPVTVRAGVESIRDAVIGMDLGYDAARGSKQIESIGNIWPGVQSIRVMGSAALGFAYAAAGRWDLYVHASLEPWDHAAGWLLVEEAGGTVTQFDGTPARLESVGLLAGAEGVRQDFVTRFGSA